VTQRIAAPSRVLGARSCLSLETAQEIIEDATVNTHTRNNTMEPNAMELLTTLGSSLRTAGKKLLPEVT
jgi:hypothetical protein